MKKLFERQRWNDKTRLLISAAATGAVLLFAMLFPLVFRQIEEQPEPTAIRLEDRAALFAGYWREGDSTEEISVEQLSPDQSTVDLCAARMQGIIAVCIADKGLDDTSPTGSEYVCVSDGTMQMNICRMWMERSGDWKNWLDVCFDADTGEIYYFYLSCECKDRMEDYSDIKSPQCQDVAAALAARQGGLIRYTDAESDGSQTVVISCEDGTICYEIACAVYDNLVDVKVNCF